MTSTGTYISIYEQRINMVANALVEHSKLGRKTAVELAKHVLQAIDRIPEKVR